MNNEKRIYIVIREDVDGMKETWEAWRNEVDAEDSANQMNDKEDESWDYYVEDIILKGYDIPNVK